MVLPPVALDTYKMSFDRRGKSPCLPSSSSFISITISERRFVPMIGRRMRTLLRFAVGANPPASVRACVTDTEPRWPISMMVDFATSPVT